MEWCKAVKLQLPLSAVSNIHHEKLKLNKRCLHPSSANNNRSFRLVNNRCTDIAKATTTFSLFTILIIDMSSLYKFLTVFPQNNLYEWLHVISQGYNAYTLYNVYMYQRISNEHQLTIYHQVHLKNVKQLLVLTRRLLATWLVLQWCSTKRSLCVCGWAFVSCLCNGHWKGHYCSFLAWTFHGLGIPIAHYLFGWLIKYCVVWVITWTFFEIQSIWIT